MDKAQETRQKIWEAYYELSGTIPFEKLTVERIASAAGVSKSTFYRHFLDKYDVLNYPPQVFTEKLIREKKCHSWEDFFMYMCEEVDRDSEYYRRAFRTCGQNGHPQYLFEYSFSVLKRYYLTANGREKLSIEEYYMISHFCHGCVDIVEEWLENKDNMTAKVMAGVMYRMMPPSLKNTWNGDL